MIYDLGIIDLVPHSVAEVEKRLGRGLARNTDGARLVASFHTEIGPLNQIIQLKAYRDIDDRERTGAGNAAVGTSAGEVSEFVVHERWETFVPFPVSPQVQPGTMGPFFEMRTYTYASGDLPNILAAWAVAMPGRLEWGPIVGVWHSAAQHVNKFFHIWPYRSLDERWMLRKQIREARAWPPLVVAEKLGMPKYTLLSMENRILVASDFSPLR